MITSFTSLAVLLIGYFVYSKLIERIAGIDTKRETPADFMSDDVDYMPLPWWRIFLISFFHTPKQLLHASTDERYRTRLNQIQKLRNP
ncbi:carbon starvation CstA family protein [Sunxiuqinia sp. sy24]|uniref:carbon starvation CstA family protein n=1 Tax=Sunxiuqinia sp. sy24 TaxID=3461495 RepID=UPI0040464C76